MFNKLLSLTNYILIKLFIKILIHQSQFLHYNCIDIKLGVLLAYNSSNIINGYKFFGTVPLVVDYINKNRTDLLNGGKLTYELADSHCNDLEGLGATIDLMEKGKS